jgi:hypothetical protein
VHHNDGGGGYFGRGSVGVVVGSDEVGPVCRQRGWLPGWAGRLKAGTWPTQEEKNHFQISFKYWIWQNFRKLYREILKELDTGFFPKIFQFL